jgi:glycosyltransferase involved in cell wall biosynthesis
MKVAIAWASFGPYHHARLKAVSDLLGEKSVLGIQISNCNQTYNWKVEGNGSSNLVSVFEERPAEDAPLLPLFFRLIKIFRSEKPDVCFVPSYWPANAAVILFAAKLTGCRCVMMNETHGGTARSAGIKHLVKKILLKMFDAGFVGGAPHRRYFVSLGLPMEKIFTGYDAVDNDYFARRAEEARSQKSEVRSRYGLPEHYFLNLGRFVAKKNLAVLIRAYHQFLYANPLTATHLVMVGSGEENPKLRALCDELQLPVYDRTKPESESRKPEIANEMPGVHFYGFRQIEENPVFYALADAFILPSLWEEWGLVVNEAMASGLPVIVSKTAGCAEDLIREGVNGFTFDPSDVEELAQLMLKLSTLNSEHSTMMGDASRDIISRWGCDNFAKNAMRAAEAALGQQRA